MVGLFEAFSQKETMYLDSHFLNHTKKIFELLGLESPQNISPKVDFPKIDIPHAKKVLLAFSGGKDSLASALWLRKYYDVSLFFLEGINKSYTSEKKQAQILAEKLALPIVFEKIHQKGSSFFKENPFKNGLLLACMVDYGVRHGFNVYSIGTQYNDTYENCNVLTEFSDAREFLRAFDVFIKSFFSNFYLQTVLKEEKNAFEIIFKEDLNLFSEVESCIMPVYRRPRLKALNEKKFDIKLKKCGSCYKCAMEYIFKIDHDLAPKNEAYYQKCKDILKKHEIDF